MRQIIQRWRRAGYDISSRPEIIATLYSYGLLHRETGQELVPHGQPRSNFLGEVARRFYESNKLTRNYPQLAYEKGHN
ncbi:MAG: hypothetical protein ONB37_08275 [candidate division KSB1 bacterium]|nr:hypothetical protein [candidate division KSB1 bacterium]